MTVLARTPLLFWSRLLLILSLLGLPGALAQSSAQTRSATPTPTPAAERAADAGITAWLHGTYNSQVGQIAQAQTPEQALKLLLEQMRFQPAPAGATINLGLRSFVGRQGGAEVYRYPVGVGERVINYQIAVARGTDGRWAPRSVSQAGGGAILPAWLRSVPAVTLFGLLSLALLVGSFVPNPFRTGLLRALAIAREQRVLFIVLELVLYGVFALGCLIGALLPEVSRALAEGLGGTLTTTGIQDFQTNVPTFATGIAVWNFSSGVVATTYLPGLVFGVPALLVNFSRLLLVGVTLAPGVSVPWRVFLLHLPTILIELQAYIFVTCSAVAWLFRWARLGFLRAWRDFAYSLVPAALLIMLGAWYEAFEILLLVPHVR